MASLKRCPDTNPESADPVFSIRRFLFVLDHNSGVLLKRGKPRLYADSVERELPVVASNFPEVSEKTDNVLRHEILVQPNKTPGGR